MQRPPPRPRPELAGGDGDDLDAGLAQGGVGQDVAVVADDDAGLERDDVVAVVPLLALDAVDVAGGRDHPEVDADAPRRSSRPGRVGSRRMSSPDGALSSGRRLNGDDAVDDRRVRRHQVVVAEGEHGVQVHRRPALRQAGDDHPLGGAGLEQVARHLGDRLVRAALAHADHDDALARSASRRRPRGWRSRGRGGSPSGSPNQTSYVLAGERRVEPVDRGGQQGLLLDAPARTSG